MACADKGLPLADSRKNGRQTPAGRATPLGRARPAWRPTRGSVESSERTRVNILWAAERVLATNGYAAFTTRAVAAAAGIERGNLAYHYKTKNELLHAVITSMLAGYNRRIDALFEERNSESTDGFANVIEWDIRDSTSRYTSLLFRELWAMASHDPFIAKALDNFYEVAAGRAAQRLRKLHPNLSASRADAIIWLLAMISEGANPIFGTAHRRKRAHFARVTQLAVQALIRAANEEDKDLRACGPGPAARPTAQP
jgi:AcrR family transcriptional regulator